MSNDERPERKGSPGGPWWGLTSLVQDWPWWARWITFMMFFIGFLVFVYQGLLSVHYGPIKLGR
jgi:hypothetical protein